MPNYYQYKIDSGIDTFSQFEAGVNFKFESTTISSDTKFKNGDLIFKYDDTHELIHNSAVYNLLRTKGKKLLNEKQVKAAGVRARKAINELKKLASKYRSTCLTESKEL